jgi:hypothetical protein
MGFQISNFRSQICSHLAPRDEARIATNLKDQDDENRHSSHLGANLSRSLRYISCQEVMDRIALGEYSRQQNDHWG